MGPKLLPAESLPHALLPGRQILVRLVDSGKVVVGRLLLFVGAVGIEDRIGMVPSCHLSVRGLDGLRVVGRHGIEAQKYQGIGRVGKGRVSGGGGGRVGRGRIGIVGVTEGGDGIGSIARGAILPPLLLPLSAEN